jgi:hypothetical protein
LATAFPIVSDEDDFGSVRFVFRERVDFELSEKSAERKVLIGGDVLVPKEDDLVIEKGLVNRGMGLGVHGLAKVDAVDYGPDAR